MNNQEKIEGGIPGFDEIINGFIYNHIRYHTIQFFKKAGSDTFEPEGTGVLVHIFGVFCVFTASHVLESMSDEKPLYFRYGVNKYISCSGLIKESDFRNNKTSPDLAYLILYEEIVKEILSLGMIFLDGSKLLSHHEALQASQYAMFGFPTDFVKIENGIMITGANLFIGPMANDKPYQYYGYDKDTHYIMPYINPREIITNEKKKSKAIYGMSGSGLWYISVTKEMDEYVYDYHLIGIMHFFNFRGKYQIIVGNKINLIADQLLLDISES